MLSVKRVKEGDFAEAAFEGPQLSVRPILRTAPVIGRESPQKPFPDIVHRFAFPVKSILDIGAGSGRFASYFLLGEYSNGRRIWRPPERPPVERYVAIEPAKASCERLMRLGDPRLTVVCGTWEEARSLPATRGPFDMAILWDVLMFIPSSDYKKLLDDIIDRVRPGGYFLFSLYPVKSGVMPPEEYEEVLRYLDNHPRLEVLAKRHMGRVYRVR